MANTLQCTDLAPVAIDFSGLSLNNGMVVSAWDQVSPDDAIRTCVTIDGSDDPTALLTANTIYNSCYECLVNNYTIVSLESCDSATIFDVDLSNFNEVPIADQSYFIRATDRYDTYIGCFKIRNITQYSLTDYTALNLFSVEFLSTASFPDCDTCLNGFSAGTESQSCQICWDGSGYTASVVSVPHPKWTNQFGQTINILDAIVLGGQNGLNN